MGFIGDSKSVSGNPWVLWGDNLITALNADYNSSPGKYFIEDTPRNWAVVANSAPQEAGTITAELLQHSVKSYADHNVFLINLGAGDFVIGTSEADYKTAMLFIIDAVKAKYANAIFFISKPWRRTYGAAANIMAGWIDDIVAARSTFCHVGDDERVWMEGGDDGATMTYDGVHYYEIVGNAGKLTAIRARLLAVVGY